MFSHNLTFPPLFHTVRRWRGSQGLIFHITLSFGILDYFSQVNNRAEHNKWLPDETEYVITSPPSACPSEQQKESIDSSEKHVVEFMYMWRILLCFWHHWISCLKCQRLLFLEEPELDVPVPYWLGSTGSVLTSLSRNACSVFSLLFLWNRTESIVFTSLNITTLF